VSGFNHQKTRNIVPLSVRYGVPGGLIVKRLYRGLPLWGVRGHHHNSPPKMGRGQGEGIYRARNEHTKSTRKTSGVKISRESERKKGEQMNETVYILLSCIPKNTGNCIIPAVVDNTPLFWRYFTFIMPYAWLWI
jgi:hypothetical protein